MATCSNCDREFEKRHDNKGYLRFSLEKPTTSGGVARDELSALTGVPFTPVYNKRIGQFLCPSCWSNLNDTVRYKSSLHELWGNTQANSYIGGKRGSDGIKQSSTVKKPRFTSQKSQKIIVPEKTTKGSKWDSIIGFVRARQYGRAIKGLYESTKGAKRQFMLFVSGVVRKEIKDILKPKTTFPLCMKADIPSITDFS
ncbi:unnamed protein product [Mytilus coruscus]|uniref:Uncharacterized protein n=1 Tax=Mytilus coruscus TaxID=42192 RepID=A0A6J8C1Y5_MYTCO|nr:unnamed protein product [Mytilus coruscus]